MDIVFRLAWLPGVGLPLLTPSASRASRRGEGKWEPRVGF